MKPRLRILHLEDNANDRELIQFSLAEQGLDHQVFPVETKTDFLTALDKGNFDIILSDSRLPKFDGQAALGMAKAKFPDTPFLFVTGHCPESQVSKLMDDGAQAVISKSNLKALAETIVAALKRKKAA
jgi:phosphoserine phosphatase RsbU/P